MDKSCQSSGDSTITTTTSSGSSTTTNSRDHYLKHLNKVSHKISKPIITKGQNFNHHPPAPPPPPPPLQPAQPVLQSQSQLQVQAQQHQPPVYNINKNDFRDVVQKLTGSPAHERFSTPPPIQPPKAPNSRLQRIRPPPLAHVSNRPPPLINSALPPPQHPLPPPANAMNLNPPVDPSNSFIQRSVVSLSPLPPFPAVHAAAESPVSAYMRCLHNSISTVDSNPKQFSGFSPLAPSVSPRWNNTAPQPHQPQPHQQQSAPPHQGVLSPPTSGMIPSQPQFQLPSSPLPFGCMNSPRSPYPLLSPSLLFSPSGQLGFPLSPTVPVPSPKWRGM